MEYNVPPRDYHGHILPVEPLESYEDYAKRWARHQRQVKRREFLNHPKVRATATTVLLAAAAVVGSALFGPTGLYPLA